MAYTTLHRAGAAISSNSERAQRHNQSSGNLKILTTTNSGHDSQIFDNIIAACKQQGDEWYKLAHWSEKSYAYSIDDSNDGTGAKAFALMNPKQGGVELGWLKSDGEFRGQGWGALLLLHAVRYSLKKSEWVSLYNGLTPPDKGRELYGNNMSFHFKVENINKNYKYYELTRADRVMVR